MKLWSCINLRCNTDPGKTVCIDFDGTLAHRPGRGLIGAPIQSGMAIVRELLRQGYRVVILTANPSPDNVARWLVAHGLPLPVTSIKPPAIAYVDSNAVEPKQSLASVMQKIKELAA